MKNVLIIALLLLPTSIAQAAHNAPENGNQSARSFSKFLKHKITPKPKSRKKRYKKIIRKQVMDIRVKVYATQQYTVDLLVTCKRRNILLTYNKIDKKFCTKKFKCKTSLKAAILPYCK